MASVLNPRIEFTKHSCERYTGRYLNKDPSEFGSKENVIRKITENNSDFQYICQDDFYGSSAYYSEEGIWIVDEKPNVKTVITFLHNSMLHVNQIKAIEAAKQGKVKKANFWYNKVYHEKVCA